MSQAIIADFTRRIERIDQTARTDFSALNQDQLNWRPAENAWSIGHCLDHLMKANAPYFKVCSRATDPAARPAILERLPVLPALWGRLLLHIVDPKTTRKARAPKKFLPAQELIPANIVDSFCQQQRSLIDAMQGLDHLDLDNVIVTSPALSFVVYSLHDALAIVVAHEERHLLQAQRVLSAMRETRPRT